MKQRPMKILMLTRSNDDACAERVLAQLESRGHQGYRWNTDVYPLEAQLSASYSGGRHRRLLRTPDFELDLAEVEAVYFRRFEAGVCLPQDLGKFRNPCYQESVQTVFGLLASLECFQLDPFWAIRRAELKETQLRFAAELGLEFPRTLFSNDPRQVRDFAAEVGEMVAKMQTKVIVHRNNEQQAAFTSMVDNLDDLEGLRYSPAMFQEKVEKKLELRVTVVGDRVFPASIDSTGSEVGSVDYRLDNDLSFGWQECEIPPQVEQALVKMVRRFGLNYGAADFILTPDDRYVFLEINSAGEWVWLARDLNLPIDQAIAEVLTVPERRLIGLEQQWSAAGF